jgi:hypothetical protein
MACFTFNVAHLTRGIFGMWRLAPLGLQHSVTSSSVAISLGSLAAMNLRQITIDYVIVDTLRVPRETFASILEAWRDGYAASVGKLTPISQELATAYFDQMIANIRNPAEYAAWMVPVVSARVSSESG